jgi:DNA-binding NarL/FixJ family response regulator
MGSSALDPARIPTRILLGGADARVADDLLAAAAAAGYCIVGKTESPRDIVEIAISLACDLIVLDVTGWTDADVLAIGEELKIAVGLPVLVVCEQLERETYRQAKAAGIDSVLLKAHSAELFESSVEFVVGASASTTGRSGTYAVAFEALEDAGLDELSAREREVFNLLASGYRTSEIGRELFISAHTVRKHAKLIFRKLGVHSQIELMRRHFGRLGPR